MFYFELIQKQTHNTFAEYAKGKKRVVLFTFQKQMPVKKNHRKKTMSCSGFKTAQNENRKHKA